ncbi:MAG: hypothetical protein U0838_00605 [Chloroflexota bacterium]
MNSHRSLALDLFLAPALDRAVVARLVADHAVGPARRAWASPRPPRRDAAGRRHAASARGYGPGWTGPVPRLVVSTALFDPVVAGYVLFRSLFPGAFVSPGPIQRDLAAPNWIYFEHSRQLAVFRYEDVERLVAGAFAEDVEPVRNPSLEGPYRVAPSPAALAELARCPRSSCAPRSTVPRPADPPLLAPSADRPAPPRRGGGLGARRGPPARRPPAVGLAREDRRPPPARRGDHRP